jgi:hypothetical protein
MLEVEKQTTQGPGRVHSLPWQQADSTAAVGLQALEESIGQEKSRSEEALEKAQARVRELENHLASQKEVHGAGGGQLKGLRETEDRWGEGVLSCPVLTWTPQLGEA